MDRSTARSIVYGTLSSCYTYPDEDIHFWLTKGIWIEEMREALRELNEEDFEKSLSPFLKILKEEEGLSSEMQREYTRLFINGFPHVVAPPFGSAYLEKTGQISRRTASQVIQFYRANGFTVKEELKDLPDHIANEFEFMADLTYQERETTGSRRILLEEEQMKFFSRFILPWVPAFCDRIRDKSLSPFYRSVGKLTLEFIDLERNYLGIPEEVSTKDGEEIEPLRI